MVVVVIAAAAATDGVVEEESVMAWKHRLQFVRSRMSGIYGSKKPQSGRIRHQGGGCER